MCIINRTPLPMKYLLIFCCCLFMLTINAYGQDSTAVRRDTSKAKPTSADDLLAGLTDSTETQALLPSKMIFTQRAFWGPKGLMRLTNIAPLSAERREKELKVRRTMLVSHQVMGFVTLAGMVTQGIVGSQLYKAQGSDYTRIKNLHTGVATFINISYTTTALLSLTAPPKMVSERKGYSSIKLHKYLAIVHIAGMITTNVLSRRMDHLRDQQEFTKVSGAKALHRAAAFTTFGAFAASIIAIKF